MGQEQKTKGIILQCIRYSETANILSVYTKDNGRESFIVYRSKTKRSGLKNVFMQPFSVVEMEVKRKNNAELHHITELRPAFSQSGILFSPIKTILSLFLSEMLYRVLRSTDRDPDLFSFLENSIQVLDLIESGIANFHLVFLIQLTRYLGYYPHIDRDEMNDDLYFDLLSGTFSHFPPSHPHFLESSETVLFQKLVRMTYENMRFFSFSRVERVDILRHIIQYYRLHLPEFPEIQSLEILKEVFDSE